MGMEERLNEIINDLMRRANTDKEEGNKCSCGKCSGAENILNHPVISSTTKCIEVMEEFIPTIDKEKVVDKEMARMILFVLYEIRKDLMSDLSAKERLSGLKDVIDSIQKDLN